eukprot:365895-Pleurochrysis_carterae.AAC.1
MGASPRGSDAGMNGDSTECTGASAASVVAGSIGSFSFAPSVDALWLTRQREKGAAHRSGIEFRAE